MEKVIYQSNHQDLTDALEPETKERLWQHINDYGMESVKVKRDVFLLFPKDSVDHLLPTYLLTFGFVEITLDTFLYLQEQAKINPTHIFQSIDRIPVIAQHDIWTHFINDGTFNIQQYDKKTYIKIDKLDITPALYDLFARDFIEISHTEYVLQTEANSVNDLPN